MPTILVPLDGSEFAEHAIPLALDLARRAGARVELVAVQELAFDLRTDAESRTLLWGYLEATRERLRATGGEVPRAAVSRGEDTDGEITDGEITDGEVTIDAVLLQGAPAEALAERVSETAPDLVVMTTHGRGGVGRLWLGSVTEGLVRRATVPVLAVRPPAPGEERAAVRAVRRVLVALDGSAEAEAVIAPVAALLGRAGVEYALLRVVPPLHPLVRAVATEIEYARDLGGEQRLANEYLHELAERLRPLGLTLTVETRINVPPAEAIVAAAAEIGADVIALGTHGRGPLGRLVFGSVADAVLRASPTPVLLYHVPKQLWDGEPGAATVTAATLNTATLSTATSSTQSSSQSSGQRM